MRQAGLPIEVLIEYVALYQKGDETIQAVSYTHLDGLSVGRRIQGAASLLDIGPTVCEAAEAMSLPEADGVSLWQTLCGEPDDLERTIVSEVCDRIGGAEGLISGKMAKWKNYKLIHYVNYDADDVLYDVAADPDESTNIIAEHPDIAAQLRRQMDQLCDCLLYTSRCV